MLSRMRSVVIESGTWRWARRASPRQVIFGNGRPLAPGHQEAISRDAQRGVMVKAAPASALIVVQAEVLFQVLVVALDAPAHLGHEHQLFQGRVLGGGAEEILGRFLLAFGPLDEQPLLDAHAVCK